MFSDKQLMRIEFGFFQPNEDSRHPSTAGHPSVAEIEKFLHQFHLLYSLVWAVDWYARESGDGQFSEKMQVFAESEDFAGVWDLTEQKFREGCERGILSKGSPHVMTPILIKSITHKSPTILEVIAVARFVIRAIGLVIEGCRRGNHSNRGGYVVSAHASVRVQGDGVDFQCESRFGYRSRPNHHRRHSLEVFSNCIKQLLRRFREFGKG